MTGSERRRLHREGHIIKYASQQLAGITSPDQLQSWKQHKNAKVSLLAFSTEIKLLNSKLPDKNLEFDSLVERFTREGKKDPIKSARASLAATSKKRSLAV